MSLPTNLSPNMPHQATVNSIVQDSLARGRAGEGDRELETKDNDTSSKTILSILTEVLELLDDTKDLFSHLQ